MAKTMLDAAITYAKIGWKVFPLLAVGRDGSCECQEGINCDKAGKHPAIKEWNKEASDSPEKLREWWAGHPTRGIGIATGEGSGLTVLDVDGDEGVAELGELAKEHEGVPITPCSSSRPGRFHYYFTYNSEIKSRSKNFGTHLDTRSDNGYVVAPPSQHATGSVYKWIIAPNKAALAEWPDWLVEKGKAGAGAKKRGRPAKEQFSPANPKDVEKLLDALSFVDPDDEEKWSMVGWIMGRAFRQSDEGFAHYRAWAARSRKFNEKRTKGHYYERSKEIRGSDLKTTGSLYTWAIEGGWAGADTGEYDKKDFNIFENPFREQTMVSEFITAATASPKIYAMGVRLVHIVTAGAAHSDEFGIERDPNSYITWDHDADTLSVALSDIAAFWSHTAKGVQRSGFPRRCVQTFIACHQYSGIKQLLAFLPHPSLRSDGSVISTVGYDQKSKLYLTGPVEGLEISAKLTQKGAREAMIQLLAPFAEYPWASGNDRAVFAASLLTVGLRHLFDVCPLFAFSSPKYGSGKTQLAECISRLWYGIDLSKATWTGNPEEMEKRIAAFLLAGDRMVCLDNVSEGVRLEDSTLNKVLTSRRNTFRILGRTERVELTNEATWFATGNQLNLSGDIARRALICYVDAKVVDPSARSFEIANLPLYITEHRAELMSYALSVVASWIAAGRPVAKKAHREYGSFTTWYAMLRPLLMWVGEADLANAIDSATEEDTEGLALETFANAVRKAMPPDGSRLALTQVMKLFEKEPELPMAFAGCMPGNANNAPNHRTLSELLRRCEHKIFLSDNPGQKFTISKKRNAASNQFLWGVEFID